MEARFFYVWFKIGSSQNHPHPIQPFNIYPNPVDHLWTTGMQKSALSDDSSRWMERGAFRHVSGS
jgi:hypothetical protein